LFEHHDFIVPRPLFIIFRAPLIALISIAERGFGLTVKKFTATIPCVVQNGLDAAMNTHREPEKNRLESIGARVRQRALTGGEASAVGFTLVAYIFAGAGLGYLLDTYLETSYCIAIGTLLGAAIGFREMFRMTKKLTQAGAQSEDDSAFKPISKREYSQPEASAQVEAPIEPESHKPRFFAVPPPPHASFDTSAKSNVSPQAGSTPDAQNDLMEQLLHEGETENELRDDAPQR
jgi:F0F1-type ATP synthase assembly protein I